MLANMHLHRRLTSGAAGHVTRRISSTELKIVFIHINEQRIKIDHSNDVIP